MSIDAQSQAIRWDSIQYNVLVNCNWATHAYTHKSKSESARAREREDLSSQHPSGTVTID